MISIVNYEVGNLASIQNMIAYIGGESEIVSTPNEIMKAQKLLLPGVGAFDHGMAKLNEKGLIPALSEKVTKEKIPILGICLGMQLMCNSSEEGVLPGLGWIDAVVRKFNYSEIAPNKVPHMGWNSIHIEKDNSLIPETEEELRYYFVHSYYVSCNNPSDKLATSSHGHEFVAAFSHENIFGTQFHPEKSHRFGMRLMERFNRI